MGIALPEEVESFCPMDETLSQSSSSSSSSSSSLVSLLSSEGVSWTLRCWK